MPLTFQKTLHNDSRFVALRNWLVPMDPQHFFDRVVVISLKTRPERLRRFHYFFCQPRWPFRTPETFSAFRGDRLPLPDSFKDGQGAFGCRQSHVSVLQHALSDNIQSLMVLEDDAVPCADFADDLERFMTYLPEDWDGIMLGGEHWEEPLPVCYGVVRCMKTVRTHAYACRPMLMQASFKTWLNCENHIDWQLPTLQKKFNIYAPARFLIGQLGGRSDIRVHDIRPTSFWNPARFSEPIIVLRSSRQTMIELLGLRFFLRFEPSPAFADRPRSPNDLSTESPEFRAVRKDQAMWYHTTTPPGMEELRGDDTVPRFIGLEPRSEVGRIGKRG